LAGTPTGTAGSAYVELFSKDTTDVGIRTAQAKLDAYAQHVQTIQAKIAAATASGNAGQAAGLQQDLAGVQQKQSTAALGVQLRQKSAAAMQEAGVAMRADAGGTGALAGGGRTAAQNMDGVADAAIRLGMVVSLVRGGIELTRMATGALRGDWEQVEEAVGHLPFKVGQVLKDAKALGHELAQMGAMLWRGQGQRDPEQEATDYANGVQTKREALEELTGAMKRNAEYDALGPEGKRKFRAQETYNKRIAEIAAQSNGINSGDDAGAADAAKAAAAEELRVALAAIPPEAQKADVGLEAIQRNADQVAQAVVAAEQELATLGMTPEQKQIFDLRALRVAGQQVDRIAEVQAKITEAKRQQAIADSVAATLADATRAAAVAGMTPSQQKLYDLAHPAGGGQAASPEQLAKVKAALDAADAAAKAAADAAAKQQGMDQFVAGVQESLKTDEQRMAELRRKTLDAVNAGTLTGAEGGAYISAMEGKFNPQLPQTVKGTFSGAAAAMALGGGGPADRTAQATEETAKGVKGMRDEIQRLEPKFGS
jgi:hypothetical protein